MIDRQKLLGGLLGVAVGDALGVPVEFRSRASLQAHPVARMRAYGTHHQPAGTWSDDSSLTFCLVESLCAGYDLRDTALRFVRWLDLGYWTPHGETFDVGGTTGRAISRLRSGMEPTQAGGRGERDNGNDSLMRILPVAFYFSASGKTEMLEATHQVSCLTHGHPRSQIACGLYNLMALELLRGASPAKGYRRAVDAAVAHYTRPPFSQELPHFTRLLSGRIDRESVEAINSGGYVVHTLEASIWALLRTHSFSDAVLLGVNLGGDTDTTGAVTGGLAGLYYGLKAISEEWLDSLARLVDIMALGERFYQHIVNSQTTT